MKNLINQMAKDLRDCAEDRNGPHTPEYYLGRNSTAGENLSVTVQWSRDPSRSNNGGEYFYDRRYFLKNGSVHSYLVSSYEDAEPEEWVDHKVALTLDGVKRCLEMARQRVLAELKPMAFDTVKIRRRVEDALRKTASEDDLLAIAGLLGVRTD